MFISIYRKYLHYFERPCSHGMAKKTWRHERIILCICDQQVSFGQIMFSPPNKIFTVRRWLIACKIGQLNQFKLNYYVAFSWCILLHRHVKTRARKTALSKRKMWPQVVQAWNMTIALLRNDQNIRICMGEKTIVSVAYESKCFK